MSRYIQSTTLIETINNSSNMKLLLAVSAFLLLISVVHSLPFDDFFENQDQDAYPGDQFGVRQRRVTCDLLSPQINVKGFGGKVNHGACAANCLSMGKAGGRCNRGICQCRKTTFKDLWKRRFG